MATKVEELQVLISANADQFKNELISVKQELRNLNRTSQVTSQSLGGTMTRSFITAQVAISVFTGSLQTLKNITVDAIRSSQLFENSLIGLETVAGRKLGQQAIPLVTQAAKDLASDGLMSVVDSAKGLKNLLASGFSLNEATNLMNVFKDSASFGRQAALTFGEAVASATEGIKNGNSILVDNAGITKNLSVILTEAGFSSQDLSRATQDVNVQQALYNGLMKEGNIFQGDAARLAGTTSGQLASLGVALANVKVQIGKFLNPIQQVIQGAVLAFVGGINSTLTSAVDGMRNLGIRIAGFMLAVVRVIGSLLSKLPIVGKGFANLANLSLKVTGSQDTLSDSVSNTADNLGDATKGARDLKKELGALAGFDELNVLSKPEDSGSGDTPSMGLPSIVGGGESAGGLASASQEINDQADIISKTFKDLFKDIKSIFKPLDDLTKKFFGKSFVDVFLDVAKVVGVVVLAFNVLSGIATVVGGAMAFIGSAVSFFLTPAIAIVAVIALIVAGFVALYNSSEGFRNIISSLIAVFVEKLPEIQTAIQPLVNSVVNLLGGAFRILGEIINFLWINVLKPLVNFILINIVPAFSVAIDIIVVVISVLAKLVSSTLDMLLPALNVLWESFKFVFESIKSVVEFVWNNILKPIFIAITDLIIRIILPTLQNLFTIFSRVFDGIRAVAEFVWSRILEAVRPVIEWFNTNIMPSINRIRDQFEVSFNAIKNVAVNIWEGIKQGFKNGINSVIGLVNGFIRNINNLIGSVNQVSISAGLQPINFQVGEIPKLARGGVVSSPTIAMMGEAGSEVVMPLENNTGWMDILANKINGSSNSNGQTLVVKIGEDTIFEKVIDYINDKATSSGKTILNI